MRHVWTICEIIVLFILSAFAARGQSLPNEAGSQAITPAQTPATVTAPTGNNEDWNRLRELVHGEEINVWASRNRHVHCLFTTATEDFLFCDPRYPYQGSSEYRFNRADVDKVRLEQGDRNFKRTIEVSAAAGAITLAAAVDTRNSGDRVLGALAGGLAGTFAGIIIAGPVALLVPGHLVYQRPHTPKTSHTKVRTPHAFEAEPPQEAQ
jgi:hypothetical protein